MKTVLESFKHGENFILIVEDIPENFRRSDQQVMELELLGSIFSRLGEASGRGGEKKIFSGNLVGWQFFYK